MPFALYSCTGSYCFREEYYQQLRNKKSIPTEVLIETADKLNDKNLFKSETEKIKIQVPNATMYNAK